MEEDQILGWGFLEACSPSFFTFAPNFKQMERDQRVFDLIDQEHHRQQEGIELIASENFVSDQVMESMGSVLTNKYAEGLPFKRYYGGCHVVDQVEQLAIDRVKELFGACWANVQPHSGASANSAVMLACLKPGDTILGFDLSHGGHLTHGSPVNYSGKSRTLKKCSTITHNSSPFTAVRFSNLEKWNMKRVVRESLAFVERELMNPDALFYSALDADSEGEEGKFYVWSKEEMKTVLGEDFDLAQDYFNLNHHGKWEGHFIPLRKDSDTQFAETKEISLEELNIGIEKIKNTLLEARASRIRPGLDDKSLTSWNALMVSGYLAAHDAFGDDHFLEMAKTVANRIWKLQRQKDGALWHNYKGGKSSINGYLEDYSFTIEAFVNLYQITYDEEWLKRSRELADYVSEHFYDEDSGMFWFTSDLDPPLIARKQELEDNVIPASNSSLAKALHLLGTLTYDQKYLDLSAQMLDNIVPTIFID